MKQMSGPHHRGPPFIPSNPSPSPFARVPPVGVSSYP